jgi:hypothetical protein
MRSSRTAKSSVSSKVVEFAALEARMMFCGYHTGANGGVITELPGIGGGTSQPNNHNSTLHTTNLSVPVLNSLLGAKATLYLDFDGDAARTWGSYNVPTTPAYDIDGNASTFSAAEIANINEIWQRVAEKFSAFNINVTTVRPAAFDNGKALQVVIGGNGSWMTGGPGGVSYVNSFTNAMPNTAYAFSGNLGNGYAKYVAEAVSHESGHAFGLQHQSSYSNGAKTAEYYGGTDLSAPTMGNSYSSARGLWWYGTSSTGGFQDDLAVISNSTNGFGYRADDFGSSPGTAKRTGWANGKFMVKGEIGNTSDRDYFRFAFSGGTLTLKLRSQGAGATLDGWLRLYNQNGTLLKHVNNPDLSETIVRSLPPGTYYAVVFSNGSYGDIGQYTLYGYDDVAASMPAPGAVPTGGSTSTSIFSTKAIAKSYWIESELESLAA